MAAPFAVLSYGENRYKAANMGSIHAEEQALRNLPYLPRKKRPKKVDLLVIRTTPSGVLGSSKPCTHCMCVLQTVLPKKGYILSTVYYTGKGGVLHDITFSNLLADTDPHTSRYYVGTNWAGGK
jgi:hypothetical protein